MKEKKIAIIIAVLAGFFTWIYTWEQDQQKFYIAAGVTVANIILAIPLSILTLGMWMFVVPLIGLGLWVWPIVDTIMKDDNWYKKA